jgi:hypothetical protein
MSGAKLKRRIARLEDSRQAGERLRALEGCQPKPEAMPGERLSLLRRDGPLAPAWGAGP